MDQQVYFVDRSNKRRLLADLLADPEIRAALIFVRNKHVVDRVTKELSYSGIRLLALHGDRSVGQRQAFLDKAKEESRRFWIATDIAARGLDFAELSHVIHLDVPYTLEAYL